MNDHQIPILGDSIHFNPGEGHRPMAAIVVDVRGDRAVNLVAFDVYGRVVPVQGVEFDPERRRPNSWAWPDEHGRSRASIGRADTHMNELTSITTPTKHE